MKLRSDFYDKIDIICSMCDCSVTSTHRSHKRNLAVGGHSKSKHLVGLAADLVPDDNIEVVRKSVVDLAHDLGLGALDEEDHVHVQVKF